MTGINRRALLAAAAAVALPRSARAQGAAAATRLQGAAAATRFKAVAVDTSPIEATGGGSTAVALRGVLGRRMAQTFADLIAPRDARAPVLVARIRSVFLASYAGGAPFDRFGEQDSIEGDGLVVAGGRTLSSTHVLTELSPSYSGAYYLQDIDRIRLDSIANQFASWLRREMGL